MILKHVFTKKTSQIARQAKKALHYAVFHNVQLILNICCLGLLFCCLELTLRHVIGGNVYDVERYQIIVRRSPIEALQNSWEDIRRN
jgi:hypothetical protein